MPPSRSSVLAALRERLEARITDILAVVEMARDEATSAESKSEGEYDTRAIEASYLAAGQGRRLTELRQLLAWVKGQRIALPREAVSLGAVVAVEEEGASTRWYFVAPAGGERLVVDDVDVLVISTSSVLGEALVGLEEGDSAEVDGTPPRELEVVRVT